MDRVRRRHPRNDHRPAPSRRRRPNHLHASVHRPRQRHLRQEGHHRRPLRPHRRRAAHRHLQRVFRPGQSSPTRHLQPVDRPRRRHRNLLGGTAVIHRRRHHRPHLKRTNPVLPGRRPLPHHRGAAPSSTAAGEHRGLQVRSPDRRDLRARDLRRPRAAPRPVAPHARGLRRAGLHPDLTEHDLDVLPTDESGGFQPGSCCGCSSGGLVQ